jgi:DNA-directed RNA polymerase specialized sigma24 family protein
MPLVYDELHRLAAAYLRRERAGHLLQTTALVHEAYLRLVDQTHADWQSRAQFFGVAAQLMRRILVDHARNQQAAKRGSGAIRLSLNELAQLDARQSRIVELRYFAGLEIAETAEVLGLSPATVKREWTAAKAWLFNQPAHCPVPLT